MLLDLYADFFARNPNAEISETEDFDEELRRFMGPEEFEDV